jgi:hypothetical protein
MYRSLIFKLLPIYVKCEVLPTSDVKRNPFLVQIIYCLLKVLISIFYFQECTVASSSSGSS